MAEAIQGLKKLERKLKQLAKQGSATVSKAALTGMAQPLRAGIRREVNASSTSPELKRAVRQTVGSSVGKRENGEYGLNVGFGVGKQSKAKKAKARARAGRGGRRGVGISWQNVHWVVFGTGEGSVLAGKIFQTEGSKRTRQSKATGKARRHKSGKSTGSTAAEFMGVIPAAIAGNIPKALAKGAEKAKIALRKEAKKRR